MPEILRLHYCELLSALYVDVGDALDVMAEVG